MSRFKEVGVSYFSNRFSDHFKKDLIDLKRDGFNSILHTYSEEDFKWSQGNVADMCKLSKDKGFKVWIDPWAVLRIFGGESLSWWLLANPDIWQVMSDGQSEPMACFNNPKTLSLMKEWIDSAMKMEIDTVMWDEPHFAIKNWIMAKGKNLIWGCRCAICQKKFEKKYNKKMPVNFDQEVTDFRSNSIKEFLTKLSLYVREIKGKTIKISTVLVSIENAMKRGASFEDMAKIKEVDDLGVDPYWFWMDPKPNVYEHNYKFAKLITDICKQYKKESHFWLQGFRIPKGREGELTTAIQAAKDSGVDKFWVWGYQGCHMMSSLASGDPKKVWQTIVKELKK